jgi:adenylylsulfate kinase
MTTTPKSGVLWFTGLSGSGKSTISEALVPRLVALGHDVEYLDGDAVRSVFPATGFTKEARDEHVRRIGFVASLLEKHGVLVVASFVSPYIESRNFVRKLCRNFVEIHVATSLEECERRDVKGLYARARRGELPRFTGIDDPYEVPPTPEMSIDTRSVSVDDACRQVILYVEKL